MAEYRLLITDVTRYGTRYCVPGWDIERQRMIRPEPPGANTGDEASRFWSEEFAGVGKVFAVGNSVHLLADDPPVHFPFPHATEDRVVVAGSNIAVNEVLSLNQLVAAVAGSVSQTAHAAFGGHLVRAHSAKAYVAAATNTASLGAIVIQPNQITFYSEERPNGSQRLRAVIQQQGVGYDFSVPADAAVKRFVDGGTAALVADRQACNSIHVRLGLSRPFADVQSCYAQVNGLLFV